MTFASAIYFTEKLACPGPGCRHQLVPPAGLAPCPGPAGRPRLRAGQPHTAGCLFSALCISLHALVFLTRFEEYNVAGIPVTPSSGSFLSFTALRSARTLASGPSATAPAAST